jgi:hypothetical protein
MRPLTAAFLVCALAALPTLTRDAAAQSQSAAPDTAMSAPEARALLDRYCVTCHNQRTRSGGLTLDGADLANLATNTVIWEKVVRKLRVGLMPPAGRPRPEKATYERFAGWLEHSIDRAAAAKGPNPGRPAVHRLNRVEYTNAIRDLLDLEIDAKAILPPDDSGFGFDNIADVLSVSPALLDRYLSAAQRISRTAVGDPTMRPAIDSYRLPYLTLTQEDRMGDDLPPGSRGGLAVRHYFPLDGEYTFKIRLQASSAQSDIRGLDEPNTVDLRIDGTRIKTFTVAAVTNQISNLFAEVKQQLDADWNLAVPVKAGSHLVSVSLDKRGWYIEGVGPSRSPVGSFGYTNAYRTSAAIGRIEMGIDELTIEGPFNPVAQRPSPSRAKIFTCAPVTTADESRCARSLLSSLARRAYRRAVTGSDLSLLMGFYTAARANAGFEAGIQAALEAMLVDPNFLFRVEHDSANAAPGTAYRLSDVELASRLSFFLWSSIPDDELLDLAIRNRLHGPGVVEAQVQRMLRDKRSSALLNFFGQWLLVRNVRAQVPDPKAFPDFDENLRHAFERETSLFLEAQLREDRGALELLTADYTFLNERLARHYGIPNLYGSHFRRVALTDPRRVGLLGQGSVLMVTSYANRTSVVQRGKWILETLLGTPPPPPPPNVPPLENTKVEGGLRQRMEMHRKNPVCAACHAQLDPLGFAFENFNGIGRWRTTDEGAPIDASGQMPGGVSFNGAVEFRTALLTYREALLRTLTEKLLTFAIGRGVEPDDMPEVRRIVSDAAPAGHRWSALIIGVVKSAPFSMRRSAS